MGSVFAPPVFLPRPNPPASYTCPVCQRSTFKTVKALRAHQSSVKHVFTCPDCNKSFMDLVALNAHQRSGKHGLPCPDCGKSLVDSFALEQHRAVHNGPQTPWPCSQCGLQFASEKGLAVHKQSHSKPLQVLCTKCNRKFKTAAALSQHMILHKEADKFPKQGTLKLTLIEPTPVPEIIPQLSNTQIRVVEPDVFPIQIPVISADLATANVVANYPYISSRFAVLGPTEQDLLYLQLQAKCHSIPRLHTQGFTLSPVSKGRGDPRIGTILRTKFQHTPTSPTNRHQKRKAVVIDCEMVTVISGRRHIASIGAVDFLTGEVLLNHYVYPEPKIVNYNTRYSGINHASMMAAVRNGAALRGWEGARQALWEHVDKDTVLIGHALQNDLATIGIIHSRVVDSQIMTGEAIFPMLSAADSLPRLTGLKALTRELAEYDIQTGRKGHTALEDAYATRDVIIWCLRYPGHLNDWAAREKHQYEENQKREKEKRDKRRQKKNEQKNAAKKSTQAVATHPPTSLQNDDYDDEDYLVEHWSDIAEECGYPHPDTGYDPWSD